MQINHNHRQCYMVILLKHEKVMSKYKTSGSGTSNRKSERSSITIYLMNSKLGNNKSRVRTKIRSDHGFVPSAGVEPARFPTGV